MATRYVSQPHVYLLRNRTETAMPEKVKGSMQTLLGQRLVADPANAVDDWTPILTLDGETRWIKTSQLSDRQQLKVFYTDVGQGDATIIEAEGAFVIIDGGPNQGLHAELTKRQNRRQALDAIEGLAPTNVRINAVIISHFDKDHYAGIRYLLDDPTYSIDRLYHNGLPRYANTAGKDLNLGTKTGPTGAEKISTDLTDINSARQQLGSGDFITPKGNLNNFAKFLDSAVKAHDAGRLGSIQRLFRRRLSEPPPTIPGLGSDVEIEILGPVPTSDSGPVRYPCLPNPQSGSDTASESHTVNGNSVVLRVLYGGKSFLFGGDLNQPAQKYLLERYGSGDAFSADVNKACHHGSSDFHLAFVKAIKPHATVFSSGDAGSYDHPLPDAIGAAAKSSRRSFPLVFSTELAREGTRHLGHINARSNGTDLVMAQKKEKKSAKTQWHTFDVPYKGPFGSH